MGAPYDKRFSVSILLWMKTEKPRQAYMDYWKGPHSQIIAASPGLLEYRQLHLSDSELGFWPDAAGLQTSIIPDRRVDGIAEVTFQKLSSPIAGRHQTDLAFADEVNVFRRTLMHMGIPFSSRWYKPASSEGTQLRDVVYLRRKQGVSARAFKSFVGDVLADEIATTSGVTELRTQVYMPWNKRTWDTPNVAHDNPPEHHLHASLIVGFSDEDARRAFYESSALRLNEGLVKVASAAHAYKIAETITFVTNGVRLQSPTT